MKKYFILLNFSLLWAMVGFAQTLDNRVRYEQLRPIELKSLSDLTISSPTLGQLLRFNGSKWVNWDPDYLSASGNVASATKLETARTISIVGDVTASGISFNGTANVPLDATVNSIKNQPIPTLTNGFLRFNGSSWIFDTSVDASATNEIQTLSANYVSGNTSNIVLSPDGGYIQFVGEGGISVLRNSSNQISISGAAVEGTSTDLLLSTYGSTGYEIVSSTKSSASENIKIVKGSGIDLTGNTSSKTITISATDNLVDNEGKLTVAAGTATTSLIHSNTTGSTDVTIAADPAVNGISVSETGNTITLDAVDKVVTNEGSLTVLTGGTNDAQIHSNTSASNDVILSGNGVIKVTEAPASGTITISYYDPSATPPLGLQNVCDVSSVTTTGAIFGLNLSINNVDVGAKGTYSTLLGGGALQNNTGVNNTAIGYRTLRVNTTGNNNVGVGYNVLLGNISGNYNTAVGSESLTANTASNNSAFGYWALKANAGGTDNTAMGANSLVANTSGSQNTAVGKNSLFANTQGNYHTAIGAEALVAVTTVGELTAVGYQALNKNTSGTKNTGLGFKALGTNQTGANNTAVGYNALTLTTAGNNTAVGAESLGKNTLGTGNTALGSTSLFTNAGGSCNTSIGDGALYTNSGVSNLTAVGYQSLYTNGSGTQNTAVGFKSLYANSGGHGNTALGYSALTTNSSGNYNTALGTSALNNNASKGELTAVGYQSLYSNSTGIQNTAVGFKSLYTNSSGQDNTAVGHNALTANYSGNYNTALGSQSLVANYEGLSNTAVGNKALESNTSGNSNTAIGSESLMTNTTVGELTAVGYQSLSSNSSGIQNTAVGFKTLKANDAGQDNTALGYQSLMSNGLGNSNTAMGSGALWSNSESSNLTAVGYHALYLNTGSENTAVGSEALYSNGTGTQNTATGNKSLYSNGSGAKNTAMGYSSLNLNSSGSQNTAVGYNSLAMNASGTNNAAIGASALPSSNGNNNVAIGYNSGQGGSPSESVYVGANSISTSASNEIVIGSNAKGQGAHTINLNESREPELYIGNSKPNDQVFYEPLYYNRIGAKGTILASVGLMTRPDWKPITIDSPDGTIAFTGDPADLIWHLSVPFNLSQGGDITVTGSGVNWTVSYTDNDKDPTNELQDFEIDPATGTIKLSGTDKTIVLGPMTDDGKGNYTVINNNTGSNCDCELIQLQIEQIRQSIDEIRLKVELKPMEWIVKK